MQTLHPSQLIGRAAWAPEVMPEDEFRARIAKLWAQIPDRDLRFLWISASEDAYGELAYLTNATPKLGGAAFIPRDGEPVMTCMLNGLDPLKTTTWVDDVRLQRGDAGAALGQLLDEVAGVRAPGSLATVGGPRLRDRARSALNKVFGGVAPTDVTPLVQKAMRCKSPRELAAIRDACRLLSETAAALRHAQGAGQPATTAVMQAEHVAYHNGAQDVRTLYSTDGGRILRPYEGPEATVADPLQAYLAVKLHGYWAEGFLAASADPGPIGHKATQALRAVCALAVPGAAAADLATAMARNIAPFGAHPMTARSVGNGIGLPLEEAPRLSQDSDDILAAGDVMTLRAGGADGQGGFAILSAMVAVHADGPETLWIGA